MTTQNQIELQSHLHTSTPGEKARGSEEVFSFTFKFSLILFGVLWGLYSRRDELELGLRLHAEEERRDVAGVAYLEGPNL